MAYKCSCGQNVKHAWIHEECAVRDILKNDRGTTLEKIIRRDYADLVKQIERE